MKKVKDSRKRWKQLVTMLLVTALLVTGTPDIVGLASEGTQEWVTTAADQSEGTQAEGQAEAAQEEEAISEEPVEQQDTSVQQDTAAKQENIEKNIENRSTAGTTERSENSQNSHEKDKAASGAKSGGSSTLKVRETEKNTKKEDKDTKTEYTYRGSAIQAKVTLKDAEDLSDEADLRVKQTTVANKIKTQIINKAVGEENTQLVDSVKAYDLSFILNGKSVDPSGSMQVTLANLGTKSGQNTLIYQVTDDGQVKNTDAVRTGSDAMQFAAKSLCTYVVLTYTTVSDVNGNDITTLYPAMVTAAQTQLESKEDGNVPVESWTRTNTPLVLKDTTGKKALAWTWSDIAGIDLSLENDSQIWNGSRSYGKHTSTSLKNGRVTAKSGKLYDSALWKNEGKAGKDTTITRIRGEFTITDKNKNNYAYTLKPVTDSENIYAKDNMFVFVYPKNVELTDDNYMDYLAFWTGSLADAGEKERTFHGRTASNYTQRTPVENVSILTDGWYMTAACNNAGSIITSTDASDYYVDVISTTDSSNGGMYRFKLVKEKKEKTQFTFRNLDTNAKTGKGGAVFELYKDGVHYSAQSENEEGRVTFNIVKPEGSDTDVYTLKETKAPEGYDKITTTWKVLVSSEGVTMVKDTEGNEMPKYPDGTYVVSSAKTDEADSTEQTAKTSSVIREYKSDDVNVTVTAENEADLPADAKLVVKPIELSQKAQENVEQAAIKEEKKAIKNILAYDIHFEADGKEVQPGATVKVSVDVPEIKAGANASVFHVDDKNKVENMDGDVDKKGNVVFETTHFSQYVIVNQSLTNSDITVTIEHYKASQDSNHQYTNDDKIYADDVKTLKVGDSIEEYNKATNWTVSKVVVQSQTGQAERTYTGEVAKNTRIPLAQSCTVKVYYTENTTSKDGGVKFYDYTVQAGQNGNTKYSINMDANYPEGSNESNRLSVGESKRNYPEYQYTCAVNNIENANAWTGHPKDGQEVTLVKGLLKGLDEHGSPKFNYYEPGFFKNEDQSEEINGKTVYTRRVINDYKLTFSQEGDTYTLSSVKKPNVNNGNTTYTEVASGGEHFFPLDDINHSAEQEKDNPHEPTYKSDCTNRENHNYYFGMRYDVDFKLGDYIGPLNYSFTGDDDLWVLYDGQVVLDLGGIHDKASDTVDLWKTILNKTSYGYKDKKEYSENLSQKDKEAVHTITVLYMERGAGESNCTMNFTLPSAEVVNVSEQKKTTLTLKKQNINGKNLEGAEFQIKKNAIIISKAESDKNGDVTLNNLPVGEYILKETKAPNTYATPTNEWIVKVTLGTDGNPVARLYKEDTVTEVDKMGSAYKIVNLTPEEIMECSKTAKVKDWDQRTYDITIDAASKVSNTTITTQKPVADIMLVLDVSGSMGYNIETYDYVAMNTSDGRDLLITSQTYYLEVKGEYKAMSYSRRKRDWYVGNTKASEYSEEYKIYKRKNITKLAALKNSVNQFIDDTTANSPDSKIGITAFSSAGYGDHGQSKELMQVGVGNNDTTLKNFVNNLNAEGGTDPAVGLNKAKEELDKIKNDGNPKYVILFTDGEPTGGGSDWNTTAQTNAETRANALKAAGYTVYTIGFDLGEKAKTFLAGGPYDGTTYPGIASKGCAKEANDAASLNEIFKEIQSEVTNNSDITGATITDVIDPRFEVVDDENKVITKERLQQAKDQKIKLKNGGVVSLDENGNQVVTWTDQTIPNKNNKEGKKNWINTITVKAKDDFIGGNKIITNGSESGITLENVGTVHFEQPAVNVKLLDITQGDKEITVFLGDEINPEKLLKQLNEEQPKINGFEKDSNGASKNTYNIPESSHLTAGEISKLLNGTQTPISKTYSYGNTQDNVGKFVYTIGVDNDKKTSHNTTTVGVQVEQYNLHVEYVPYTMNERETNKAPGTLSTAPGTELLGTDKKTSDNYYYVNVVAGKIQLIKKLDSDTPAPDSDKTFKFNVEYTAPGRTASELKQINLIVDKVTKISGEEMVVYGTPDSQQLPRGTYVIKESLNPEYKLKNIENSITSTTSTSEGSQSVTKTTNCYNEISNPITDASSITFMIGTDGNRKVIGKDKNGNVTGLDETEIEKTTSKEGVVTAIKATKAAEGYATFTNEARLSTIHIKKVDADGKTPLEGAMFTLKKKGTEDELQKITTDKNGEADFTGIAPGTYQITEVQSPKGYTLLANPIEVTLPYTASSTDDVSTTATPIVIDSKNYYYNITYTIKNNKLFNMPASGGRFKATLIGIAVMIMAAGCYVLRHRRKRII